MDRLARNLDDLRRQVQGFTKRGIRIEFVKESLTFTSEDSPMANLMLSVMGAFADYAKSASMQSGDPKLVLWRGLHGCGALHNAGPSTEGTRRYYRRLEEAGSALYRRQPRLSGLREGSSSASPSQPNAWTRVSVGSEPRYYAESQAADMQAKVPLRPSDFA